jgi:hypothetical protein
MGMKPKDPKGLKTAMLTPARRTMLASIAGTIKPIRLPLSLRP